jgi:L-threonylcarbamoyladenylate synthase
MVTPGEIAQAARLIREGQLVAFPTETVYGLGANALDRIAVRRIFELKGRPQTSPVILHAASIEMAKSLVAHWPEQAEELAREHWPGPLTIILPKRPHIPDEVTAGLDTVGIRMPAHPIALDLIQTAGVPIAAPSANRFTQLSPTTADHVRRAFGDAVMILDGGPAQVGIESTIVSLTGPEPVLLRPGMIPFEDIRRVTRVDSGAHPAPGMHPRHYSPRTRVILVDGVELPPGDGAYLWWSRNGRNRASQAAKSVRMPPEPREYAAQLYDTLHVLDSEGWAWIAVERPPSTPEWAGIRDRLERASQ